MSHEPKPSEHAMRVSSPFKCDNCGHKPALQSVIRSHGDCEKCGDTVICYTVDAAECISRLVAGLEDIEREASGALNNAFPDEAPDVLANVAGIASRTLNSAYPAIAPAVAELTRENVEQARLLGAGASREAALMAQVGERDRRIAELEEALRRISDMAGKQPALMSEEGLRAMSETVGLEAEAVLAKSERSAP